MAQQEERNLEIAQGWQHDPNPQVGAWAQHVIQSAQEWLPGLRLSDEEGW